MKKSVVIMGMAMTLGALTSCGGPISTPKTLELVSGADVVKDNQMPSKASVEVGKTYFISALALRIRSEANTNAGSIRGYLSRNDQVKVISTTDLEGDYIEVEVVKTYNNVGSAERYYISYKYLSDQKIDFKEFKGDLFMVQNIATEQMRVYKRICADNSCPHKMILEAEMVSGEDKKGVRTWLGSYRLTHWRKFYQDGAGHYPSWYNPSYPMPPAPTKGVLSWLKKKYMPKVNGKRKGEMRGAFGWYAGFVAPNTNAQWTHGTIGWGVDKDKYIKRTKKLIANILSNPRSHGCSRTDNETIAYLREHLPVGTPVLKVYAIEKLRDESLQRYTEESRNWDYILTKRDSQKVNGQTSDRAKVLAAGVRPSEIIEEGTYTVDKIPTVIEFKEKGRIRRSLGRQGNVYGAKKEEMHGVFYIDQGLFEGYAHPDKDTISVGGFKDELLPDFVNNDKLRL